jgi:hypothetical protein
MVYKRYLNLFFILLILTILFLATSCKQSESFSLNGKVTISKNSFFIKAPKGIYDLEITFESKVSLALIYTYKETNYSQKYNDIKTIKLYDIDFGKYFIKCDLFDLKVIPTITYKINFIKKQYWYSSRYESEPDDDFEVASDFILASYNTYSYVGRLINENDVDFFSILNDTYFDMNCILTISTSDDNFTAILYDENKNIISNVNKNLPFKFLSKKKYYLKINSKTSDFYDLPYIIIIKPITLLTNFSEFEPNNTAENANKIEINQTIFGEVSEEDIDYFTFNVEKEGFYRIIFSSSSFPFSISLIADFGSFFGDYKMHRAGSFRNLLLPKGIYYIKLSKVENSPIKTFSYNIKVENDSSSLEIEPNDDEESANEFTIFDTLVGSISWEYDIDYYFIQLEKDQNNIIISTEDPFSILKCEIFVDNIFISSFDIKEGSNQILVNGKKVLIKLSSLNFTKEIVYTIKVGN